jgi:hypothetical protein
MFYREFLVLGLDLYPRDARVRGGHLRDKVAVVSVAERLAAVGDVRELPLRRGPSSARGLDHLGDARVVVRVKALVYDVVVRVEDHRHARAAAHFENLFGRVYVFVVLKRYAHAHGLGQPRYLLDETVGAPALPAVNFYQSPRRARLAQHVHHARVRLKNLHAVNDYVRGVGAEHDELIRVQDQTYAKFGRAFTGPRDLFAKLFEHVGARLVVCEREESRGHSVEAQAARDSVTGVSGSGKSSLAFDTIYAEGQRRYVESLSAYARQFLERMDKPDVDDRGHLARHRHRQKNSTRNPRSTVGTQTEIYDYLRLLYARVGMTFCRVCGREVHKDSPEFLRALRVQVRRHVYAQPEPRLFSFNNPFGACPTCQGFGNTIGSTSISSSRTRSSRSRRRRDRAVDEAAVRVGALAELKRFARGKDSADVPFDVELTRLQQQKQSSSKATAASSGVRGFFEWLETKKYKLHVRVFLSRIAAT